MACALGLAPTDDNELLAVQAFDLEPSSPARLVRCVSAFRDDAFKPMFAGQSMKRRPAPDLMVSELQTRRCIGQQRLQPVLALDQRQCAQVLTIAEQQVEQEKD